MSNIFSDAYGSPRKPNRQEKSWVNHFKDVFESSAQYDGYSFREILPAVLDDVLLEVMQNQSVHGKNSVTSAKEFTGFDSLYDVETIISAGRFALKGAGGRDDAEIERVLSSMPNFSEVRAEPPSVIPDYVPIAWSGLQAAVA